MLKEKLTSTPILVFRKWGVEFHVHVNASCIVLRVVLTQEGAKDLDHPIAFTSHWLSKAEKNHSMTKCKGLTMVYALQKYWHYLLGGHFKMYTDRSVLKHLVNKPMLQGCICRWLLLFQEYEFEVVVKPGQLNA